MTIPEFFDALTVARADGYRPYLVAQSGRQIIRLTSPRGDAHCPITAVYEHATGQTCPPMAVYSTMHPLVQLVTIKYPNVRLPGQAPRP